MIAPVCTVQQRFAEITVWFKQRHLRAASHHQELLSVWPQKSGQFWGMEGCALGGGRDTQRHVQMKLEVIHLASCSKHYRTKQELLLKSTGEANSCHSPLVRAELAAAPNKGLGTGSWRARAQGDSAQVAKRTPGIRLVYTIRHSTDLCQWELLNEKQLKSGGIKLYRSAARKFTDTTSHVAFFFPHFSVSSTTALYEEQKLNKKKIAVMKHSGWEIRINIPTTGSFKSSVYSSTFAEL